MGFVGNIIESIMTAAVSESPESQVSGAIHKGGWCMRLTKPTVLVRLLISLQMHLSSIFCASLWFYLEHKENIGKGYFYGNYFFLISGIIFFLLLCDFAAFASASFSCLPPRRDSPPAERSPPPIETRKEIWFPTWKSQNISAPENITASYSCGGESGFVNILVVRSLRLLRLVRVSCKQKREFTELAVLTVYFTLLYYILPYFNIAVLVCISWVDTGLPVMIKFQKSCKSWDLWEALRMLRIFRTVWRLVYGLLTSGNAMLSTFFILLLTLYIYACLGRAYRKTMKNPGGGGHKHGRVLETFWLFEYYSVEDWVIGSIRFSAHACLHLQKHHHLVSCRCNIRMGSKKLITRWA